MLEAAVFGILVNAPTSHAGEARSNPARSGASRTSHIGRSLGYEQICCLVGLECTRDAAFKILTAFLS